MPRTLLVLALVLIALSEASAQDGNGTRRLPPAASYRVAPAGGTIKVDGRLDDAGWQGAQDIPIDFEYTPGDNTPAPVRSVCHITFDHDNLYLGCEGFDPRPQEIRARRFDRDNVNRLVLDDHFVFLIDPFNDQRRAFQFRVNALGAQAEAVLSTAEGYEDWSWDAIWASAGRLTDTGFEVEAAIPFKSLRFPKTDEVQTWGVLLERSWPRDLRHRMGSAPRDRRNTCLLCEANKVTGFQGITPGRNIEIAPTVTGSRTDARSDFPAGPLEEGSFTAEVGGDFRWGVTPNVSFNATVNPDFSQVEADVAQLDVNTRFALFYPEKRPFFLEGADFFNTPVQAVFTRTVADPDAGLKLTGKVGKTTSNAVGLFTARDALTNLLLPSNQATGATSLDQEAYTVVSRYRRDVGSASYVGALYTGRYGDAYANSLGGLDLYHQLGRSTSVRAQYLASVTDYPDQVVSGFGQPDGAFRGGAFNVQLNHQTDRWAASGSYQDLSPNFRADVGFVPRVDTRSVELNGSRLLYREKGWYNLLSPGVFYQQVSDHNGELTDRAGGLTLTYQGPLQGAAHLNLYRARELYLGVVYDKTRFAGTYSFKPSGSLGFGIAAHAGDAVDYTNERLAKEFRLTPSANISIGRGLSFEISDDFQRLSDAGTEIFRANLLQSKVIYQVSTRTMLRAIVQFRDLTRNPAAYAVPVNERDQNLFGQFLFSYKVNPQTVVFLGYSENNGATQDFDLTRRNRTLFTKVGYAWRP
jgi:hypothetical protein